jgi:hypothetical protein
MSIYFFNTKLAKIEWKKFKRPKAHITHQSHIDEYFPYKYMYKINFLYGGPNRPGTMTLRI